MHLKDVKIGDSTYYAVRLSVSNGCKGCIALEDKKHLCGALPACSKRNSATGYSYIFKLKGDSK